MNIEINCFNFNINYILFKNKSGANSFITCNLHFHITHRILLSGRNLIPINSTFTWIVRISQDNLSRRHFPHYTAKIHCFYLYSDDSRQKHSQFYWTIFSHIPVNASSSHQRTRQLNTKVVAIIKKRIILL